MKSYKKQISVKTKHRVDYHFIKIPNNVFLDATASIYGKVFNRLICDWWFE